MTLRKPLFYGPMRPVYPCRLLPTRHCPASYLKGCDAKPCARYESEDPWPWVPEVIDWDDPWPRAYAFWPWSYGVIGNANTCQTGEH